MSFLGQYPGSVASQSGAAGCIPLGGSLQGKELLAGTSLEEVISGFEACVRLKPLNQGVVDSNDLAGGVPGRLTLSVLWPDFGRGSSYTLS